MFFDFYFFVHLFVMNKKIKTEKNVGEQGKASRAEALRQIELANDMLDEKWAREIEQYYCARLCESAQQREAL